MPEKIQERKLNQTTKLFLSRSLKLTITSRILFYRQPSGEIEFDPDTLTNVTYVCILAMTKK
jgi:hypothetical protein